MTKSAVSYPKAVFRTCSVIIRYSLKICKINMKTVVPDPQAFTFIKTTFWHRYFPVNFSKFLRTTFFNRNATGGCFWLSNTLHSKRFLIELVFNRESWKEYSIEIKYALIQKELILFVKVFNIFQ